MFSFLEGPAFDFLSAIRALRKNRGLVFGSVASLVVGMGATTTVFTVASALLLRPPFVQDVKRLVHIKAATKEGASRPISLPEYQQLSSIMPAFVGVAATTERPMSLRVGDHAEQIVGVVASTNFFALLGKQPALGRFFALDDSSSAGQFVTVLSHGLWMRSFGGRRDILGQAVTIDDRSYTIVGVAPAQFSGVFIGVAFDLWIPLSPESAAVAVIDALGTRPATYLELVGRLRRDESFAQAEASMAVAARDVDEFLPAAQRGSRYHIDHVTGLDAEVRTPLIVFVATLLGFASLVLLIGCVNVAGLFLARGIARRRETAVRIALGASRTRIVRQLVFEALLLFVTAAVGGLLVSQWVMGSLRVLLSRITVRLDVDLGTDWRIVTFAMGLAVVAGIVTGLAPALEASGSAPADVLRDGVVGGGRRGARLRDVMIVGQFALAVVLLCEAGLFVRSLRYASTADAGFEPTGLQSIAVRLPPGKYDDGGARGVYARILLATLEVPGVTTSTLAQRVPLSIGSNTMHVRDAGEVRGDVAALDADYSIVGPRYFETLRVPLLEGREFTLADSVGAPRVAIINRHLAAKLWPSGHALGSQLQVTSDSSGPMQVVGIARDGAYRSIGEAQRNYTYLPFGQHRAPTILLVVRAPAPSTALSTAFRSAWHAIDPDIADPDSRPVEDAISTALLPQRLGAIVVGTLGVLGALLAAVGLFGVLSHWVGRRTREIGLRAALGAPAHAVAWFVVRRGMVLACVGTAVGVALAVVAAKAVRGLLLGIGTTDAVTFSVVPAVALLIGIVASAIPAWRAVRLDPKIALGTE